VPSLGVGGGGACVGADEECMYSREKNVTQGLSSDSPLYKLLPPR